MDLKFPTHNDVVRFLNDTKEEELLSNGILLLKRDAEFVFADSRNMTAYEALDLNAAVKECENPIRLHYGRF